MSSDEIQWQKFWDKFSYRLQTYFDSDDPDEPYDDVDLKSIDKTLKVLQNLSMTVDKFKDMIKLNRVSLKYFRLYFYHLSSSYLWLIQKKHLNPRFVNIDLNIKLLLKLLIWMKQFAAKQYQVYDLIPSESMSDEVDVDDQERSKVLWKLLSDAEVRYHPDNYLPSTAGLRASRKPLTYDALANAQRVDKRVPVHRGTYSADANRRPLVDGVEFKYVPSKSKPSTRKIHSAPHS